MLCKICVICFVILLSLTAMAQNPEQEPVLSRIKIEVPSTQQMDRLAEKFEILRSEDRFLEMVVPRDALREVEEIAGFKALILEEDIRAEGLKSLGRDEYPSIPDIESKLKRYAQDYPTFVAYEQYGTANQYPLMALKLSDNPQMNENEPAVLLTAATHGDELITTMVILAVIEKFIKDYGVDARITRLVNEREIWFLPAVSPYGYANRSRYVGGVDPNRDFPWPEQPQHTSIACIDGLRNFYANKNLVASIDYHAYGEMIMYPWAYTSNAVPNESVFNKLTKDMAQFNQYSYGQISKIIYIAKGSSADYFYWQHSSKAIASEVGNSKIPHGAEITRVIAENMDAAIHFIEFSAK